MKKITSSTVQRFIVSLSLVVLCVSFYLQYGKGLEPCPLCLMQRICTIIILALGVVSLYRAPIRRQSRVLVQILLAFLGLFFALRQLWLLSLPTDQVPACLPGLAVLIHYFPWQDTVRALIWGSGDCTEIRWTWLGLSIPLWSSLYFLFIAIAGSLAYYKRRQELTHTQ